MLIAKEIAYHAAREKACHDNAARAADDDTAARHNALAQMHAERRAALEAEGLEPSILTQGASTGHR